MSKSSDISKAAKAYLVDCMDVSGYELEPKNEQELILAVHSIFMSEYGWAIERHGKHNALKDWLSGLPSAVSLSYNFYEIVELAKKWGSLDNDASEKEEDKIVNNWWNFMAAKLLQMFNKALKEAK